MLLVVVGTINRYPPPAEGWEVVHVDRSSRGIWDAEQHISVPIDVQADMRQLPFADSTVDRIQCWHALEHVNEQGGHDAIREFGRVLKTGGVLDISVPDLAFAQQVDDIATVLPLIYGDQFVMVDAELNAHRWGYTERTLTALLAEHGFDSQPTVKAYPDELHLLGTRCRS